MAQDFSLQRVLATEERSGFYGRREHVRAEGKKTSQGAPSTVCTHQPCKPKFLTHRQDNSFIFNHHSGILGCVAWEHPDELEGSLLQRGRLGQSLDARRVRFRGQSALVAGPGPQVRHQRLQALQR